MIPHPTLQLSEAPDELGTFRLTWTSDLPGSVTIVEESTTPDFAGAAIAYQGTRRTMTRYGPAPGTYFYRVRELQGAQSSDYSSTVVVSVQQAGDWLVAVPDPNDSTVRTLHRALFRMCAARGDLFAVLSVPAHYREPDILAHVTDLTSGDTGALSYGAIYHPWLIGREENQVDSLRTTPPAGVAAGVMAKRSLRRGAWIAPANEPLHGVVALDPCEPCWTGARLKACVGRVDCLAELSVEAVAQEIHLAREHGSRLLEYPVVSKNSILLKTTVIA